MPRRSSSKAPARKYKAKRSVMPQQAFVMVEPTKSGRATARKTYKSYRKAEKAPGIISTGGKALGGALGSLFGPAGTGIGSFLGGKLGHLVETVTGFGDYTVHGNTVMTGGLSPPQIVNSVNDGGVIIRHREYLGDIPSTIDFTIQEFIIQPGFGNTFPWLSQVANAFEQYKLRGMLFEFKSTSSDAILSSSTSSSLGSVSMMTEYDVADPPPTSKRQMLNAEYSSSNKPSCSFIHPIECKRSQTPLDMLYTRGTLNVPNGFDQRLYDFAKFYIATEGMQGVVGNVGELWVTYEIELFKPQFNFVSIADHFRTSAISNALPLGTASSITNALAGGTLGGTCAGRTYSFPPFVSSGTYLIAYWVIGGGIANASLANYTLNNCVILNMLQNDTLSGVAMPAPTTATLQNSVGTVITISVIGQNASIVFATTGIMPGPTPYGDLFVVRLPDAMGQVPA